MATAGNGCASLPKPPRQQPVGKCIGSEANERRDAISTFDPLEALTVRQAAALLRVSRPTPEKYIKACELPSILIGRCRRIRRADLEDFLERRAAYGWRPYRQEPTPVDPPPERFTPGEPDGQSIPF